MSLPFEGEERLSHALRGNFEMTQNWKTWRSRFAPSELLPHHLCSSILISCLVTVVAIFRKIARKSVLLESPAQLEQIFQEPTNATESRLPSMATNGNMPSDDELSQPGTPPGDENDVEEVEETNQTPKSALKRGTSAPIPEPPVARPPLPEQPDPTQEVIDKLNPLSPEIISRQATINIGTIGHVAHGKSTVVKAISGVQTVRFKNELERNITIKLGYANAKIYKCDSPSCPRPTCYRSFKSEKEVDPPCEREGCQGTYRLLRHVS
jgi:hypothetical protein